jgi:light-regulated signal transduction histidine kinase (bacteriophytochrome)
MNRFLLRLTRDSAGGIHTIDYRFRVKSGEFRWVRCYAVVSKRNKSGEPEQVLGTAYNVSSEKETALQLKRSNEQLQQFAAVASHDLKEPLRKISLFSNLILTADWDKLTETTRTNLQRITDAAIRMQNLIEGVLAYSTANVQTEKRTVILETLLQEALQNLDYKVAETGAEVISDGLPEANVVPVQMQQLFQNLLANALTFSKKGVAPKICITHSVLPSTEIQLTNLQPASQYLKIEIADNGIGFSSEAAEKIFGLFQRLHSHSDFEGYGLGLAICKRIVENHGGVISASSEKGVGSTFVVVLPLA